MTQLIKEGKYHNLVISEDPVSEDFQKHHRVFQIVHKEFGTVPAEGVNYPQAVQTLDYLDQYQETVETSPGPAADDAFQAFLKGMGADDDEGDLH